MNVVVLDIETTGLDPAEDEVVAVGFSDVLQYRPYIFVRRPGEPEQFLISRVVSKLDALDVDTVIGYNVGFDRDFLVRRSAYFSVLRFIDLYPHTKAYFKRARRLRDAVFELFGFEEDDENGDKVPQLWAVGKTEEIRKHLEADIKRTWLLANFFMTLIREKLLLPDDRRI